MNRLSGSNVRKRRGLILVFICMTLLAGGVLTSSARKTGYASQRPGRRDNKKQESNEKPSLPMAVFAESEPADPEERALRRLRNSRYDKGHVVPFDKERLDTVERTKISHFWLNMPALPAAQSDVVVLGKVLSSKAFLSNDKTNAYSEFTIHVERILKDDGRLSRGTLIAEREGANVQLPDGRVIKYRIVDQGTPKVGEQYIFFLTYYNEGQVYRILTGYGLKDRRIYPLDDSIGRFKAYAGSDEEIFTEVVKAAVENPPPSPQDTRVKQ